MSRRVVLRMLAAFAVLTVAAAACSSGTTEGSNSPAPVGGARKTIEIAFMGGLTGPASGSVLPGFQGASLAVDQANAGKFGTLPMRIQLVQEDTTGVAARGASAAKRVVADPAIVGVLGPTFSGESLAAGPILDKAGIPFVTWSATDPALAANGWKHWFRANGNDNDQAPSDAAYIAKVLKPNCAFVLSDDTAYGRSLGQIVVNTLRSDAVRYIAELGAVPTGATGQTRDLSPFVRKIARSHCSALFYGGSDAESGTLRAQMTQKGLGHVTMVSGDKSFTTTFIGSAGVAGNGTVTTCPCGDVITARNPEAATFVADYTARWGEAPGVYSADAYDVTRMFINALLAGHTDPASITTYLDAVHYSGLARNYAFAPNHELVKSDVKIYFWRDVGQTWVNLGWDRLVLPKA